MAMKSGILTDKEVRRFDQQIQIPGVGLSGQEKIKKARILVIGAGGKGASVLQSLVAAGTGNIGICDNYLVEETALPRQSLYGESDLGRQKAIISRQRLADLSRMTTIELHNICLAESNILPIISDYDIIVDATDNFPAHYLISDTAAKINKPVVVGILQQGSVLFGILNHAGGLSLRDHYPVPPQDSMEIFAEGIAYAHFLYSIAGELMAHEALKIALGFNNLLADKMLRFCLTDYSLKLESGAGKTR
jgi:sulfur-carrier protein adenylyltransferase/sulfurtransferase